MKDVRDASAILEPEPHLAYRNGFIDIETGHDDLFPEWWQKATNVKKSRKPKLLSSGSLSHQSIVAPKQRKKAIPEDSKTCCGLLVEAVEGVFW